MRLTNTILLLACLVGCGSSVTVDAGTDTATDIAITDVPTDATPQCTSSRDCSALHPVCDPTTLSCVDCSTDADCPSNSFCSGHTCHPQVCSPGATLCQSTSTLSTCAPNGSAWVNTPCVVWANATSLCSAGSCTVACSRGFADCDGNSANGCETNTDTSTTSCGSCGNACGGGTPCVFGTCGLLVSGLGGIAGYGSNRMDLNDDTSGPATDLTMVSPTGLLYYGTRYTQIFVNRYGDASFGSGYAGSLGPPFPIAGPAFLAPWWGAVSTNNRSLADGSHDAVYWDVRSRQFVATWLNVGYFATHDDLQNTFQIVIRNRSDVAAGDFDVEYRYQRCEWTTGDASGGSGGLGGFPAQVGFNGGDPGGGHLTLPGSGTAAILMLCTTSNVGIPGIWRYEVRGGIVM